MRTGISPIFAVAFMGLASLGLETVFGLFFAAIAGALVALFVTKPPKR